MHKPIQVVAPSPFDVAKRAQELGEWYEEPTTDYKLWRRVHFWLKQRYKAKYIHMLDIDVNYYIIEFNDSKLAMEFVLKYA